MEFCRQYESPAIIPPEIAVFIGIEWGGGSVSLASIVVDVERLRRDGVSHSTSGERPPRGTDISDSGHRCMFSFESRRTA